MTYLVLKWYSELLTRFRTAIRDLKFLGEISPSRFLAKFFKKYCCDFLIGCRCSATIFTQMFDVLNEKLKLDSIKGTSRWLIITNRKTGFSGILELPHSLVTPSLSEKGSSYKRTTSSFWATLNLFSLQTLLSGPSCLLPGVFASGFQSGLD